MHRHLPVLLLAGLVTGLACKSTTPAPTPPQPDDDGVMCTMDAKICPDGSAVRRSGPDCAFDPCPTSSEDGEPDEGEPDPDGPEEPEPEEPELSSFARAVLDEQAALRVFAPVNPPKQGITIHDFMDV